MRGPRAGTEHDHHGRILSRSRRGHPPDPELGTRLRRECDAARRPRVGRARRDPVAHHRRSRPHRAVFVRLHRSGVCRAIGSHDARGPRGALLGRCRYRHGHLGQHPRPGRDRQQRHHRAAHGVGTPVLRHPREDPVGGLRRVRAGRRFRRVVAADPGRLRRGQGRVGAERHQDVDLQRRYRRHPRGRGLRRSRVGLAWAGQLHRPTQDPWTLSGAEVLEDGHPGVAHRRSHPSRLPGSRPLPARGQGQARREALPRPPGDQVDWPGGHEDVRSHPARRRRPGARHRSCRL